MRQTAKNSVAKVLVIFGKIRIIFDHAKGLVEISTGFVHKTGPKLESMKWCSDPQTPSLTTTVSRRYAPGFHLDFEIN